MVPSPVAFGLAGRLNGQMRQNNMRVFHLAAGAVFAAAALLSVAVAIPVMRQIESRLAADVMRELAEDGHGWATVQSDGLLVRLVGHAPDETSRFRALQAAGRAVRADRLSVDTQVFSTARAAPRFFVEIHRDGPGLSLVGVVPAATDRKAMAESLTGLPGGANVTDLLESAGFAAPDGWDRSLDYALRALEVLPMSKILVTAERIEISAVSGSGHAKTALESALGRAVPEGIDLILDISAPRQMIMPFALRFLIDGAGARFETCSASTEADRSRILEAAAGAGLESGANCRLGLGSPGADWPDAVTAGIDILRRFGGGSLEFFRYGRLAGRAGGRRPCIV